MPSPEELPHLIALLDDESEVVQDNVEQALRSFGPRLEALLQTHAPSVDPEKEDRLQTLCMELRQANFDAHWLDWLEQENPYQALESAFSWLAYLDHGYAQPPLSQLLDEMKMEYLRQSESGDREALMHYFYHEKKFRPPSEDYYNPVHSNLVQVIQNRQGIQISLSCILMLLGARVDIQLYGLNMPGHFMLYSIEGEELAIYDPFNEGRALPQKTMTYLQEALQLRGKDLKKLEARPYEIIMRVLRNYNNAYQRKAKPEKAGQYRRLEEELMERLKA